MGLHALEARFEEVDLRLPVDKAEVGDGVDALAAIFEDALHARRSPRIVGVLKLWKISMALATLTLPSGP